MRIRLHVHTRAAIGHDDLLRPGRSMLYGMLTAADPTLGQLLHAHQWRGLAPFGHGGLHLDPPEPSGKRTGIIEIGTPLAPIGQAWVQTLRTWQFIDWGGAALHLEKWSIMEPPPMPNRGPVRWHTCTPILVRASHGTTRELAPGHKQYMPQLGYNARKKLKSLGLPDRAMVLGIKSTSDAITYKTLGDDKEDGAPKTGHLATVAVDAHPDALRALWCWGLGHQTSAGFGWIRDNRTMP